MQALRLLEVATAQATRTRVLKALEAADEKDAVFFICRSSEIIDAVLREIGIDVNARGEFHVQ